MAKLTLDDLLSLANQTTAIDTINANNAAIEAALEKTLSRDGTSPNAMEASLDMNSNRIINLPAPVDDQEPVRLAEHAEVLAQLDDLDTAVDAAEASATAAAASASSASSSAAAAAASAAEAATFDPDLYLTKADNLASVVSASTSRTNLGLGTAAVKNTGTSGNNVPLLDAANTWSDKQTILGASQSLYTGTSSAGILFAVNANTAFVSGVNQVVNTYRDVVLDGLTHSIRLSGAETVAISGGTVGIGSSASATDKLLIDADGSTTNHILFRDTGLNGMYFKQNTNGSVEMAVLDASSNILIQATQNITLGANSSGLTAVLTSTGLGVGISPSHRLHVYGDTNGAISSVTQNNTNGTGAYAQHSIQASTNFMTFGVRSPLHSAGALAYLYTETVPIAFFTSAAERMRIDGSGRVLINTSSAVEVQSGVTPYLQLLGTTASTVRALQGRYSADASPPVLEFIKSRHATIGSNTIVQDGDSLGQLTFRGADGTGYIIAAAIHAICNGTPGTDDMPGALIFSTTAEAGSAASERMRIDSSGVASVGHSTALATKLATTSVTPKMQVTGLDTSAATLISRFSADADGPTIYFGKSRAATAGSYTVVQTSDVLGRLSFGGADGTDMAEGARIEAVVHASPGAGDMPTKLAFFTSADASESPTERMCVDDAGRFLINYTTVPTGYTIGKLYVNGLAQYGAPAGPGMRYQVVSGRWWFSGINANNDTLNDVAIAASGGLDFLVTTGGNIVVGTHSAIATNATNGFLYVPTCAGTPTGTPTAFTGKAAIVVNTTNNKLYFYSGGAWRDAGP